MDDDSKSRSDEAPGETSHAPRRRASEIITDFVAHAHGETISVGDLTTLLGDRAFGMLLLVLTLPNIIPLPGLSTATGVPMIVLGAQLAMGMDAPRLPRRLANISFARDSLLGVLRRVVPSIEMVEQRVRPRLPWFCEGVGERLAGLAVMILALALSLPIVFGNLPPALAIAIVAMGLIEKDGLVTALGLVSGVLAIIIVSLIVLSLGEAALFAAAQTLPFLFPQAAPSCSPTC